MAYGVDCSTFHVRLKTKRDDVRRVVLLSGDPFNWKPNPEKPGHYQYATEDLVRLEMQNEGATAHHDCWFAEVKILSWPRIKYAFLLFDDSQCWLFDSGEPRLLTSSETAAVDHSLFFVYPYLLEEDLYSAPSWVSETVWYQIFPDSFSRGESPEDTLSSSWGKPAQGSGRYGGNLQGVIEKLDYIQEMGFTGIYFTPIFTSPSTHKYDIVDYYTIDPEFGDNALFGELVQNAHKRGIRVMLDAVFNHCSSQHPFWQDVLKNGKQSPYYGCFYIIDENRPIGPEQPIGHQGEHLNYRTFGFVPDMPKWNTSHPIAREYLLDVACFWAREYHIDAWRLDVSNEVSHDFWREFRKRVREVNPALYIVGENWDFSYPWLRGDQMDAVMNYRLGTPIYNFVGAEEKVKKISADSFCREINRVMTDYPKNVLPNQFNLLDSHDTPRLMHRCGNNEKRAGIALALLFCFAGCPSIYYGTEIGLSGDDEFNRRPMKWQSSHHGTNLSQLLRRLIHLRKIASPFRSTEYHWVLVDDQNGILLCEKRDKEKQVYLLLHNKEGKAAVELPAFLQEVPLYNLIEGTLIQPCKTLSLGAYEFLFLSKERFWQ